MILSFARLSIELQNFGKVVQFLTEHWLIVHFANNLLHRKKYHDIGSRMDYKKAANFWQSGVGDLFFYPIFYRDRSPE